MLNEFTPTLISERWPLITQEITVEQEIEYDNLYLDMNSILHNCSHSNDGEISRLTEEQIFGAIFAYIDYLFNLIKPKKVFYMAIDGVAPRAKMNQQRARRFRSAQEAEELLKKAIETGEPIPKDPAFDTNAITPGTEFMARVTENLKFYINQKVSQDKHWQDIEVILSGHEVPGEGEHKIMEYIRTQKAQPSYNENTRHCVYGLDADLIVLGLVAHEPHFSLLREEVTFGRNKKKTTDVSDQTFFLLHISLVRDYLEEEFSSLSDDLSFEYDFERILDDLILILYVIGNDFLPNLPDLHLNKGAFPLLIHTFKEAMRRTDGYLNENGKINLKRLAVWLDILSIFELENFEEGAIDVEWFNKQLDNVSRKGERKRERQGKELLLKQQKKLVGLIGTWILKVYHDQFDIKEFHNDDTKIPELSLPSDFFESELNLEFMKKFAYDLGLFIIHSKSTNKYTARLDIDGIDQDETEEDFKERLIEIKQTIRRYQTSVIVEDENVLHSEEDLYNEKFENWKDEYYREKVGFTIKDTDKLKEMTENYIEGLQWVLNYYYTGISSWPWYYRYHYAPRISDLVTGLNVNINFELGSPFTPFEQLMSVLPERSKELIPVCYRHLMTDEDSPIIDFYPRDCKVDKNGKTASWEAVVLLSFVDEKRLKEAMAPLNSKLTIEEKKRNSFGHNLIYNYNPQIKTLIKSPLPSAFPDFQSHATESEYILPSMEGKHFIIGLIEGVKTGVNMLAGFPTLKTIPHTSKLINASLTVFQQPTRSESMILTLENEFENINPEQFSQLYCGKIVYAGWPYLKEYKVVKVTDSLMMYENSKTKSGEVISSPLESFEISEYNKHVDDIVYTMHFRNGLHITTTDIVDEVIAGNDNSKKPYSLEPEPIDGLVYAKKVIGVTPNSHGKLIKVFSDKVEYFPMQLIVPSIQNIDPRFEEKEPIPLCEEYPAGTPIIFLGKMAYGTPAVVVGSEDNTLAIQFSKQTTPEPTYGTQAAKIEHASIIYHSAFEASKILGLNTFILSKITSNLMVMDSNSKKINVGLGLKFEGKGIKTLGYTRKNGRYWEYSDLALHMIKEYISKFSNLLRALQSYKSNNIPKITELFPRYSEEQSSELLRDVKDYLLNKHEKLTQVSLSSDSLSIASIGNIEKQIIQYSQTPQPIKTLNVKSIPRFAVLNPSVPVLKLKQQEFRLGDRVLYVLVSGKVPLFSKGTVIGFRSSETAVSVHVLFDLPILTGNRFSGRLTTQRGLSVDSSSLLNITLKQFVYIPRNTIRESQSNVKKQEIQAQKEKEINLRKESKKELLSLISGKKAPNDKKKVELPKNDSTSSAPLTSTTAKNNNDAKKILNMLVGTVSSTQNPTNTPPAQPQVFNGYPVPYPPINGMNGNFVAPMMPYPMNMMAPPPNMTPNMYPYISQPPPVLIPQQQQQQQQHTPVVDSKKSEQVLSILKKDSVENKENTDSTKETTVESKSNHNNNNNNNNNNVRGTRGGRGRGYHNRGGPRGNHRGGRGSSRGVSKEAATTETK
ncbi:hypothetical protein C6P40_001968 [Pichia californica]|uniref:5'-3' exoribonuclease 1 n=1 Tax=Pichia californica TaxID=460514 RepID=A0A9P6WJ11_9ASCO|nr:hypothetical protein C6P42_001962 [[Candida] californica]KAG0687719.1 hypothetical protein C6P40_001968 [[Candida] californica]